MTAAEHDRAVRLARELSSAREDERRANSRTAEDVRAVLRDALGPARDLAAVLSEWTED